MLVEIGERWMGCGGVRPRVEFECWFFSLAFSHCYSVRGVMWFGWPGERRGVMFFLLYRVSAYVVFNQGAVW